MPVMEMEEVRAARDLWRGDKPAFVWAMGLVLLIVWGVASLAGGPKWLRPFLRISGWWERSCSRSGWRSGSLSPHGAENSSSGPTGNEKGKGPGRRGPACGTRAENLRNLETLEICTGPSIRTNPALGASIMLWGQFPAGDF